VGLSQWGAKEMADLGRQYWEILKFYYPLAEIRPLMATGQP
jgi:SpoIID/LytB domain protein